jgi:predicted negative regulator of RcsB-dependent stress response
MKAYDLEEQEQLATLKAWWRDHGNLVLTAITVALLAFAAWNGWNWYRNSQSLEAAALYETLQSAARANDMKAARDASGTLLEKYSRTAYGALAALVSAKIHYQAGDLKTAKAQLEWAVENAREDELKSVARLRLAHVLVDENAHEEALKVVTAAPSPGFEALFETTRGDIYLVQKKSAEARNAYRAALEKADRKGAVQSEQLKQQLQLKLDALGEG